MRAWLIVVWVSLGCGSAKVADAPGDTRELVGVRLDASAPAPIDAELLGGWLHYEGFPAISEDGKWVAIVVPESDGARGFPNLHGYLQSTDGEVDDHVVILDPEDGASLGPEVEEVEARGPAADRTLSALRKFRARLSRHTWTPLTEAEGKAAEYGEEASEPWLTADNTLMVHYVEPTLYVDWATGNDVFMRDVPGLSAPVYDVCEDAARQNLAPGEVIDDEDKCPCSNPAVTGQVWTTADARVAVVRVTYQGTDMCWEPSDSWFTFTVPTAPGKVWKPTPRRPELVDLGAIWSALDIDPEALPGDGSHDDATRFHRRWASRFPNAPEVKAAATVMARTR